MSVRLPRFLSRLRLRNPVGPGSSPGLRISYRPKADGLPDPGEVVWTWVAYEDDPTQGKDRPVLSSARRPGSSWRCS